MQRTTEAAGWRAAEHRHAGGTFAFPRPWDWHKDARGRSCAYVGIDLTGVRQQAKNGGKAEGRMPYVAMIFNPVPELPDDSPHRPPPDARMQARYLSGLYDLDRLGLELRKQAGQVGMDKAEVWIGLTDGGNGLEEFVRRNFPRDPVLILDFWHASEYLTELGRLLHPADEETRQRVVGEWCRLLKREGGGRVLEILEALPASRKPAVREKQTATVNYFRNNVHRMDYPDVCRQRLVDRFGCGGVGLQDDRRPTAEAVGDALAGIRHGHALSFAGVVQERGRAMAGVLASLVPSQKPPPEHRFYQLKETPTHAQQGLARLGAGEEAIWRAGDRLERQGDADHQ